ncbi:uncharacterized protein Triagg1_1930 [Trichoderma aggressivum f. europaeum]|uniref:Uncharacterized protein n=1 Tax=Trichoderma aggressivum f. europaeum TaxID=173218 RepID=A0AAE1IIA2_9HYPO|nr:hypothetical protein Triagg1_1930 [Trichoderma aggressivum f. europaeum]
MDSYANSPALPNIALESRRIVHTRHGESSNMSASVDQEAVQRDEAEASTVHVRAMVAAVQQQQQQKTRRRRGSLRKVALLGRGAQRDRRDWPLAIETDAIADAPISESARFGPTSGSGSGSGPGSASTVHNALGLNISPISSPTNEYPCQPNLNLIGSPAPSACFDAGMGGSERQADMYNFTTDEEDIIQLGTHASQSLRSSLPLSSGSESYYVGLTATERRQKAKSPLSYSASTLPQQVVGWDYSETEWWGWVVLTVTWFVFVIGMGSCFEVWRWAWDVGTTPYAPPEFEDDPTLPIVGYYPALITLTCVMAWVWVVVAWVGMKYFRHAKISGD